ncbi:MAG: hypothetical protein R3B89_28500 [Polyangiaceae bacterium]
MGVRSLSGANEAVSSIDGSSPGASEAAAVRVNPAIALRLVRELRAALKRRPKSELPLAGALRVFAPWSSELQQELTQALMTLVRRGSFERPIFGSGIRALAEGAPEVAADVVDAALGKDGAGGLATLSAACFCADTQIGPGLSRIVVGSQPHLAFAAELARAARGESDGGLLGGLAPRIKESHRIALCLELLLPLSRGMPLPAGVSRALQVLRSTERHLGRWLVMAQVSQRAGDVSVCEEALREATDGAVSSRPAWLLVAWALGAALDEPVRLNLELIARLSDRPSADRDPSFLFRLARAGRPEARAMLDTMTGGGRPKDALGVRAALRLAQHFDDGAQAEARRRGLEELAEGSGKDPLRALAVAALADLDAQQGGVASDLRQRMLELQRSKTLRAACWAGLAECTPGRVVGEATFRRLEYGWIE